MNGSPAGERRWLPVAAALVALPLSVLLDTGIALLRGWEPSGSLHLLVVGASLAAVAFVAALAALAPGRRALARAAAPVAVTLASLVLGLGSLELAANLSPRTFGSTLPHSRGPDIHRVFHPDPAVLPGISGPSRYDTDDLGIRADGPPPAGRTYKILCVGGSTTECTYLDDDETWPSLLMRRLNRRRPSHPVWVGNLGISGYTTVEHLDFLRHSRRANQFDCLVFLPGINDLLHFLNGSLEVGPRPLWRRSAVVDALLALHRRNVLHRALYTQEDDRGWSLVGRRRARRAAESTAPLPDLGKALDGYRGRIGSLIDHCHERGLRCIFLTAPVLWRSDLDEAARRSLWLGWNERGEYLDPGRLRTAMDRYNQALVDTCRRRGAEVVRLDSLNGRRACFYDDCHFTEQGAREVAGILAAYLATHTGTDDAGGSRARSPDSER